MIIMMTASHYSRIKLDNTPLRNVPLGYDYIYTKLATRYDINEVSSLIH